MARWEGFVWCNPPYGPRTFEWLARLATHEPGGIALTFARTETQGFFNTVWDQASSVVFVRGRLRFYRPNGMVTRQTSGAPSVLVGYGREATRRLSANRSLGAFIRLRP